MGCSGVKIELDLGVGSSDVGRGSEVFIAHIFSSEREPKRSVCVAVFLVPFFSKSCCCCVCDAAAECGAAVPGMTHYGRCASA